jgi:hypothetical protein
MSGRVTRARRSCSGDGRPSVASDRRENSTKIRQSTFFTSESRQHVCHCMSAVPLATESRAQILNAGCLFLTLHIALDATRA